MISATATVEWNMEIADRIAAAVARGVTAGAAIVRDEAKNNCPVATGALQASIESTEAEVDGEVAEAAAFAGAEHAAFVEFGTGISGMGTYPFDLPSSGVPYTGSWVYDFRNQDWIGHPASPYMRPGLDSAFPAVLEAISKEVEGAIR